MITIEQIKEYTKCPQFGDKDYGKWGALRLEQRKAYRDLIDIIEGMEQEIEKLKEKIENMKMSYETDAEAKYYDFVNKHESKLQQRIDNAIEYMNDTIDFSWKNNSPIKNGKSLNLNKLLDILQGVDKE